MIDRVARNRLAENIRALANGLITNDEFEDRVPLSEDVAINEIFLSGAWLLYCDMSTYTLTGKHKLSATSKKEVARWVLFLKSNIEYKWPPRRFTDLLLATFTLGLWLKVVERKLLKAGDLNAWPFLDKRQLEISKTGSAYCAG